MWFFMLLLFVPSAAAQVGDPCLEGNYRNITNIYRSTGFRSEPPYTPICDDNLEPGWYRFNGSAGDKMPNSCVDKFMCGTIAPIWMNGEHPSLSENEVLRQACASTHIAGASSNECCTQSLEVGVKNCFNQFFVYLLFPTPACNMGYCAGSDAVCPIEQWSRNNNLLPDCKGVPVPRFSGPVIVGRSFHFICEITYNEHDSDLAFEVVWLFDGAEDAKLNSTLIYEPNRTAILEGYFLQGHINTDVGCKVRGIYQTVNVYSPWKESSITYWAGIRVEPEMIKISMADSGKDITVTSTLPILSDNINCGLIFKLAINKSHDVVKAQSACQYTLDMSTWSSTTSQTSRVIPVVASYDPIQGINADAQLTFERLPSNLINGPYIAIFNDFLPNSVQFQVETVEAKYCNITGDPHIIGLKGNSFDHYCVGVYTVFESKYRHFELQIETWPCNKVQNGRAVTCICAVAIHEMNDLIRFKGCDYSYYDYEHEIASPELEVVRKRDATVIEQSSDGRQIVVRLPSGAEIYVISSAGMNGYMDLALKIPPLDKDRGSGLCGSFDNSNNVQYTLRGGGLDTSFNASECQPQSFINSWKVSSYQNLLDGIPPIVNDTYESKYCTCNNNTQIECVLRLSPNTLHCPSCHPINIDRCSYLPNSCSSTTKRSDLYEDSDEVILTYNREDYIDFQPAAGGWPTLSGITEQIAEGKCRESLERSQLWSYCSHREEYNQIKINECKKDIMFGDSYDTLDSVTDSFTLTCQVEMGKDANNYVTTPDGQSVLKPEISTDVCSTYCLRHGHCERGLCVCEEGYAGSNCQLLKDQPPELIRIRGSTICSINERPCRRIYIDSYNIEWRDTMACKVTEILPDGMPSNTSSIQEAIFISNSKLACSLPDARITIDRAVKTFKVTATIDGVVYSNALNMTVFDSTCLNCTESGCERIPSTCFINNLCYLDGDPNPNDVTQICNVNLDETHWSPVPTVASDYPVILAVDLSGPTNEGVLVCSVNTSDSRATARFKVSWFVNGQAYPFPRELNIQETLYHAVFQTNDLPSSGILVCKIRSYYSDRNILSPYVTSNAIDLGLLGVSG